MRHSQSPLSQLGDIELIKRRSSPYTSLSLRSNMPGQTHLKRGSIPSMETTGDALTEETVVVVLGASGDLAKKKTFPALFALYQQELLPKDLHIVGYARTSEFIA